MELVHSLKESAPAPFFPFTQRNRLYWRNVEVFEWSWRMVKAKKEYKCALQGSTAWFFFYALVTPKRIIWESRATRLHYDNTEKSSHPFIPIFFFFSEKKRKSSLAFIKSIVRRCLMVSLIKTRHKSPALNETHAHTHNFVRSSSGICVSCERPTRHFTVNNSSSSLSLSQSVDFSWRNRRCE